MPSGDIISYLSNSAGKRVVRKKNGAITAYYLYQSGSQIGAVLDSSGNLLQSFVYGSNPLVPDYMIFAGVEYRIITDWRGSVRLVVNSATGAFVQRIDYDEFGQILSDSNPEFQPFGFAGGIYDTDTKLTRFGVREYSPGTGRFLSKDPLRFAAGQANLYGYVYNDPINLIDPTGKFTIQFGGSTSVSGVVGTVGAEYGTAVILNWSGISVTKYFTGTGGFGAAIGASAGGAISVSPFANNESQVRGESGGAALFLGPLGTFSLTFGSGGPTVGYSNGFGSQYGFNFISNTTQLGKDINPIQVQECPSPN